MRELGLSRYQGRNRAYIDLACERYTQVKDLAANRPVGQGPLVLERSACFPPPRSTAKLYGVHNYCGANRMNVATEFRHKRFKKPPIVEAIIAVTIKPLPDSALATLINLSASLAGLGYSLETTMTQHDLELAVEKGVSRASNRDEIRGYQFFSADRRFAFQILRTGLIFSQLGHYESWELFTAEARKIWDVYLSAIGEVSVDQYAVRYINKIFIPLGEPTENYVRLHISVPPDLPQAIFNPYLRLTFLLSNPTGTLTHQQGLLPAEKEGFASTLLDNEFAFPASHLTLDGLWPAIDSVRDAKDHYFFNMLTDKMKETFDA